MTDDNGSDKQMGNLRNDGQVKQVIYGDNGVKIVSGNEVYMGCDNATEDNGSGKRMGNLRNDGQLKQVNYGDNGVKKNSGNEVYMGCDKSSTSCAVIEVECGKDNVEMGCDSCATINGGGKKTGNMRGKVHEVRLGYDNGDNKKLLAALPARTNDNMNDEVYQGCENKLGNMIGGVVAAMYWIVTMVTARSWAI